MNEFTWFFDSDDSVDIATRPEVIRGKYRGRIWLLCLCDCFVIHWNYEVFR